MKKIITFAFLLMSFISFGQQKKDSTKTVAKDTTVRIQYFGIILNQFQIKYLLDMLKTADMKPTEVNGELNFLISNFQVISSGTDSTTKTKKK